ncbi:GNAT family N-acetyltransferase [Niabella digestorum]|jgi:Acetyltransferases|uniref:GNAT family N-acetyltransferase n=1 Tax=Niabella digestorum TaxID=3117701 RepID=A0ABU7RK06_9BACT
MIQLAEEQFKCKIRQLFLERWGSDFMISRGKKHRVADLESFLYIEDNDIKGLLTFTIENEAIEIVSLDSFSEGHGVGTALVAAIIDFYKSGHHKKLWLATTNDNTRALRFYQKRGFTITAIHLNAIEDARKIKPSIPLVGYDGIPILHEIELTYSE